MKCIEIIRQIVLSSALRDEPSVMNKLVLRYRTYAINIGLPHYHAKANIFDLLCTHLQLRRLACRIHHRAMTWHCKSAFDIDGLWWLLIDAIFHHIVKFAAIPHCNIILFDVNLIFWIHSFWYNILLHWSTWYFALLLIWKNQRNR